MTDAAKTSTIGDPVIRTVLIYMVSMERLIVSATLLASETSTSTDEDAPSPAIGDLLFVV
jgi:hypothetical protein